MAKSNNLTDFFKDLAEVIREKEGSSALINPQDMAARIAAIGGKQRESTPRTTLKETLQDIADGIRIAEGSEALINPQEMAMRIAAIEALPELPYEEIEFVTLDGTMVYDSKYRGNNKTTIEIKFKRSNITSNVYLFGSSGTTTTYLNAYMASNGNWRYGNFQQIYNTRQTKLFVAEMTPGRITVDGVSTEFTPNEFTTSNTIAVGGRKTSSTVFDSLFRGYIYYFRMSIDGVMVADWIPVRRLSDGLECFWDKVSQTFIEPISQS